jgi:hypothetical protein
MALAGNVAALASTVTSAVVLVCYSQASALAFDFLLGDTKVNVNGTATYGTGYRADGRDPQLLPPASAAAIGAVGQAPGGQNSDDGNLNFNRGDRVSTVLKAVGRIDIEHGNIGARIGAKAWHDFVLGEKNVPWGHLPNGYAPNSPLDDSNFHPLAKFSGAALMDAYAQGRFGLGDSSILARLGQQTIPWAAPGSTIRGGLDEINAYDIPAMMRPGAVSEESDIPVPAAYTRLELSKNLGLEAFYQFRFEPNQIPGCGTFNSHADYAAEGCDKVVVGNFNDRIALANGLFAKRAPDRYPSDGGQYGLGLTYLVDGLGRFGLYYATVHSRRWVPSAIKSSRAAVLPPLIPGDPDGRNVQYFVEYPDSVRMYSMTFVTRMPDQTAFFAELTHQPNQSVRLNGTDLLNAFASNVAPSQLRAEANATPAGAAFHGFDRLRVTHLKAGVSKPLGQFLGASQIVLAGEAGMKYMHGLPDASARRYGRGDPFGLGPVNGSCIGSAIQCSNDGYVTPLSWGYRVRASLLFPDVVGGIDLRPSVGFLHDVKGWSYDESFTEKRKVVQASLRAEYRKRYYADFTWTAIWGGIYDSSRDRDVYILSTGIEF